MRRCRWHKQCKISNMYNVPYRLATTETTHRTPYQCLMPMLTSSAHVYVAKLWLMIRSWDASFKEDSAVLPGRASCWNSRSSSWMMVLTLIRTLSGSSFWLHLAGVPPASRRALTHLCVVLRLLRNSGYGTRCSSQHSPRATHSGCCSQSHLAVGAARSGYHPAEAFRV